MLFRSGEKVLAALEGYKRDLPARKVRPAIAPGLAREIYEQALPETGLDPEDLVE